MSDDVSLESFDFGGDDVAPKEKPEPSQQSPESPPIVDPAEWQRTQERLADAEKFRQDLARVIQSQGLQPAQTQDDDTAFLNELAKNPRKVIAEQAALEAQRQMQVAQLRQEYSAKYPHLASDPILHDSVVAEAEQIAMQAYRTGKPMTEREALDQAAQNWTNRVQQITQATSQAQREDSIKKASIPFTVPAQGQPFTPGTPDFSAMSHTDFANYRAQYLRSKGISA